MSRLPAGTRTGLLCRTVCAALMLMLALASPGTLPADSGGDSQPGNPDSWEAFLEEEALLLEELDSLLSPWFFEVVIHTGGGFRENVLRGSGARRDGWAHLIGAEAFWTYQAQPDRRWTLLASAEAARYPRVEEARDEVLVFATTRWTQPLVGDFKGWIGGTLAYSQQPFDLAAVELEIIPETIRVRTIRPEAGMVRTLGRAGRIEWRAGVNRAIYQFSVDDYYEADTRIGVELARPASPWSLGFGVERGWRWFDSRAPRDAAGESLPDQRLRYDRALLYAEAGWRTGSNRRWTTRLRTTTGLRRDNAGGYFDYRSRQVSLSQEFRTRPWSVRASFAVSEYAYDTQPVGPADERTHLWRDWSSRLEWDWRIHPRGTLRWMGSWERLASRREHETFRSRFAGVAFRWEI